MLHEEALHMLEESGSSWGIAWATTALGEATADAGENPQAANLFRNALTLHVLLGDRMGISFCLIGLGKLAGDSGRLDQATRLLSAAEALRESCGLTISPVDRVPYDKHVAGARAGLGEEQFVAEWAAGRELALAQVLADAEGVGVDFPDTSPQNRQPSPAELAGLSRREVEVLRLIAAGRTDREIAESLFIARTTASDHVAHIRAKLGVATRAEAASWAVRNGLA
jgi:non-specific serine/threonine protein kinase